MNEEYPDINPKLLSPYNPAETEDRIYKLWEESGFFNPDVCIEKGVTKSDAEAFSIVLPPPNVTGTLHIGHASMLVIEDIMTRFARMQGKRTLWLPGTDHAAIATQSKVEKILEKEEGKRKSDLGREEFLKRVEAFAQDSHDTIVSQVKKMGASIDWSREAFTLDEKRNLAVRTAFKKMYDEGLIYRGHRIVNWDPKGQTVISDDEIVYKEEKTKFYYLKYGPFTIGTARPETKFGDKYVVMHPSDKRYAEYKHGQQIDLEWINGPITATIIKDESIDMEFGTGVMTITPWHSAVDFDIAQRHNLDKEQIIDKYGKLLPIAGDFAGTKIKDARLKIIEKLESKGLVEKVEDYTHNIATAERTEATIEPQIMNQWFINVNKPIPSRGDKTLKELMLEPVKNSDIKILPDRFERVYYNWVENLRDWCISRQIWYGHRIPVWYDSDGKEHLEKKIHLTLIRHGESEDNTKKITGGCLDSPLSKDGERQAKLTAEQFEKKDYDYIISSDLKRAHDTAEYIGEKLQLPIQTWPELREVDGGEKINSTPRIKGVSILERVITENTGETLEELENRAKKILERLSDFSDGSRIVIVGHNSFLSVLASVLDGKTKSEFLRDRKKWHLNNAQLLDKTVLLNPQGQDITQDEDTLDTWFSSGLWTFSTLGWPEQTKDLADYHPTTVLETGYDIIFFWVARMILMSQYILGEIPFKNVYLHGLVRDAQGRKMSKSLGNIIDPLDVVAKYGADAVRMSLIIGTGPGNDSKMSEDKIKAYKNYANKLWNITRFVLSSTDGISYDPKYNEYTDIDKNLISERDGVLENITKEMEEYKFYLVGDKIYQYTWTRFADVIIEESKTILQGDDNLAKVSRAQFLLDTLTKIITILHPFMPFVTEEIWSLLPVENKNLLMVTAWPTK